MSAAKGNKNATEGKKSVIGRPTAYKPEYCEQIIQLGREGKSMAQMACHFGIARENLYGWAKRYPAFHTALARAREEMQAYLEAYGAANLGNREFNAHLWVKTMQSRFRADYTDKQSHDVSGSVSVLFSKDDKGLL